MGRPQRYLAPGAYYHVAAKGNNDAPIFFDADDRTAFVQILGRVLRRYRWRLHVRCLMGNPYHLLVETPEPNLSDGMRDLNGQYARVFNARHGRKHHVFGQRFWSKVIESEEQYGYTLEYIVQNPVHHGFVQRLRDWRWTSAPEVGGIDSPGVARHRQADPAAVPSGLSDGRAAPADGQGREVERRGLFGDVGRGLRPAVLLRSGRVVGPGCPPPVPTRRVHRRGALHAPVGELLPRQARIGRRRARSPPDRAVPARRKICVRGAAPARAPEPGAGPTRFRGAGFRDGGPRRGARPGLHTGDAGPPRQARRRDLEAADDQVPVLLDLPEPAERANVESVRTAFGQRQLVRGRPGPRPQRHPHLPRVANPRRHPLRDAPRT